jgi:Uma2 family endonuclease
MTFAEYLKYEAPPGFRDELIHGEIVLTASPKINHQKICQRLERLLYDIILPEFIAQRDTTMYVAGDEGPRPDVFVIRKDRWEQGDQTIGYPEGVPELVIEVRSPSNSESELEEEKRSIYCSDPRCLASWVVNPEAKTVTVFTASTKQVLSVGTVTLPIEIGGASIPLARIFN